MMSPLLFNTSADDVNLLGNNVDTIKKNIETLIYASKEVGLEIHVEKTKYVLLSRHQNVGQNENIKTANRSFENVSHFKYWGTTVSIQNLIQKKKKFRFNSSNACYHSVQNFLSSRLLSRNVKIRIYKTNFAFGLILGERKLYGKLCALVISAPLIAYIIGIDAHTCDPCEHLSIGITN
jgi:hypothetical protein